MEEWSKAPTSTTATVSFQDRHVQSVSVHIQLFATSTDYFIIVWPYNDTVYPKITLQMRQLSSGG